MDSEEPSYKHFKHLSSILNERLKEQGKTQISQQSQPKHEELERYLNEPIARENEDTLDFWTTNQNKYLCLVPVAFDMLVIPASSAPVERVFSTAGVVTSGRRNCLQDKNLEPEVLIKKILMPQWLFVITYIVAVTMALVLVYFDQVKLHYTIMWFAGPKKLLHVSIYCTGPGVGDLNGQ